MWKPMCDCPEGEVRLKLEESSGKLGERVAFCYSYKGVFYMILGDDARKKCRPVGLATVPIAWDWLYGAERNYS